MSTKNWNKEVIAVNREDAKSIAKEFQYVWIRDVLLQCGLDIEDCFPEEDDPDKMTIEQKIKLRRTLRTNDIYVDAPGDGSAKIYFNNQIIGEWKTPKFFLHQDLKKVDHKDRLYTCIHIEYWSYFDGEEYEDEDEEDEDDDEYEYEDEA